MFKYEKATFKICTRMKFIYITKFVKGNKKQTKRNFGGNIRKLVWGFGHKVLKQNYGENFRNIIV